jgi:hypothetical protein
MPTAKWKRDITLEPGDTVYHILYGREWVGIVLEVERVKTGTVMKSRLKALVYMVPGTEYELYFEKAFSKKEGHRRGWVTATWLVKYDNPSVVLEK